MYGISEDSGNSVPKTLKNFDLSIRRARGRSGARCAEPTLGLWVATDLVGIGATFEEVADVLGNSPEIVRKHYAKWSKQRQVRLDNLVQTVHEDAWRRASSGA